MKKTLRVPYVIYADFETLNKGSTSKTQLFEPCSYGYKVICTDPNFSKETSVVQRSRRLSKNVRMSS